MIGYLKGTLVAKHPPELLLDVGGVGYEIHAPMSTFYNLPEPGQGVALFTHLAVSDTAHTLFGFLQVEDRTLFRALIKVSGVGPKLALTILSGISTAEFAQAIAGSDTAMLVRLPGIGKKTAQRLIIDMKDPLDKLDLIALSSGTPGSDGLAGREAFSALQALGYKDAEIRRMLKDLDTDSCSTEELIRQALKGGAQ